MQRLLTGQDMDYSGWVMVQPNRYRYLTQAMDSIEVRIVINEYLGGIVCWD